MEKVLVLAGVTGAGKTALSLLLAQYLPVEIINADSVSVYRGMDIGSAKPSLEERTQVIHHLIDICDCDENFDVARFQAYARKLVSEIHSRGKLPLLVGGTGLYINALLYDYRFEKEETKLDLRAYSNEALWQQIKAYDPFLLEKLHINNRVRLERMVQKLHEAKDMEHYGHKLLYDAKVFFLQGDRELLYQRIDERVDRMAAEGLLEEVQALYKKYPDFFTYSSSKAIGYREFKDYFLGSKDFPEVLTEIKRDTRRFAKRQITWFRHKIDCEWIDISQEKYQDHVLRLSLDWYKL